MKKFLILAGGTIILAVIVFIGYVGVRLYLEYYFFSHREEIEQKLHKSVEAAQDKAVADDQAQQTKLNDSIRNNTSFLVDPEGYQTEDNWLAAGIGREIAGMAFIILHPGGQLPDFKVKAQVDPDKPQVHIEISGFDDEENATITADLKPAFAWDAQGYAELARKLLGKAASQSSGDSTDILTRLQDLTGHTLATEDIRLSANLQQTPASWQDHEAAALALTAMALRENAGFFNDERSLLSRATAHLAMAKALRGNQPETWPGLIADSALRTLAGRELDALASLDKLSARTDCPLSAKPWITALRLVAKQDWRVTKVTSDSPLLVKIAWFQVLNNDLRASTATHRLEGILFDPSRDPDAEINQNSPDWNISDWGRAVLVSPLGFSVENGHRFTENNIILELKEMNDVLKIEGGDPVNEQNIAATFSERENGTITKDDKGKILVQVIGRGTFKAATRRHLFNVMLQTYYWMNQLLGLPEDAEVFRAKMDSLYRGVPQYDLLWKGTEPLSQEMRRRQYDVWSAQKKTWLVWEVPSFLVRDLPGHHLANSFYARGVPFGTVYRVNLRLGFINSIGRKDYTAEFNEIDRKVKELPIDEQGGAFQKLSKPLNARMQADQPHGPAALEQKLLKLAPDQYDLVVDHVPVEKLLPVVGSFLDYNMRPISEMERLYRQYIDDATHEMIWRRHAALDPDGYFGLAYLLRQEGKFDEAAEMDRKGVAGGYDQVAMSNAVGDLVDYDLVHGKTDEAIQVAQKAADTGSQRGMETQMHVLEKQDKLDQAESIGQEIKERYGDDDDLVALYAQYGSHFPDKHSELERKFFPNGLNRIEFISYSQKEKPEAGCQITSDSPQLKPAGLLKNDIIVALDGYEIKSEMQYVFVRSLTDTPKMVFVVWRDKKYLEINASLPGRRFYADISDYGSQ